MGLTVIEKNEKSGELESYIVYVGSIIMGEQHCNRCCCDKEYQGEASLIKCALTGKVADVFWRADGDYDHVGFDLKALIEITAKLTGEYLGANPNARLVQSYPSLGDQVEAVVRLIRSEIYRCAALEFSKRKIDDDERESERRAILLEMEKAAITEP